MKRRIFCILLAFVVLMSLSGCNREDKKEGEYQIYYLNMNKTKLVQEAYDSNGAEGEELLMELLMRLQSPPDSSKLWQTIPPDVKVNGISVNGAYLFVDFSAEYKNMTDDELHQLIQKELYVDEACLSGLFKGKKLAEYVERAMYVCPHCGLSVFESKDNVVECKKCGMQVEYLPTKQLEGINCDFDFEFVNDWYEYQCDFINKLDTRDYYDKVIYSEKATVKEVIIYKNKELIKENSTVTLCGNKITFEEGDDIVEMPFDKVSAVTVLGRNKLNVYFDGRVYQFKGDKRFNALKFVNVYYRNKNIISGNENSKFLGI